MVGWSRRSRESSERAAAWAAREKACIAGGCECYCHVPHEPESFLGILFFLVPVIVVLGLIMFGLVWALQRDQAENPPEPYYCTGITSTGAPANCHPAVMSPEDLKKYEDHFKQK